ncbi:hypothetical protein [Bacillus cereus]|uniref:DUF3961 domain-containing protein n=1 Tax=Bacillus cereus (strain VD146) TaxID=1053236 RepID=R8MDT0_BACCX|nr:hypothetical protein [Bacillus cereus]EOP32272.1 hypothetical protein IK1_05808 [Bacillus cereus VD146]
MIKNNVIRINNRSIVAPKQKVIRNKNNSVAMKKVLRQRFERMNYWLGIDGCINSQIWFYGTFGLATFMLTFTYIISGILFGF